MTIFEHHRFRKLVAQTAKAAGYCPITVSQIVRTARASGVGSLSAQAKHAVPAPMRSATVGGAA